MKGKIGMKKELICQACGKTIKTIVHSQSETFLLRKYKWGVISMFNGATNFHWLIYLCDKCYPKISNLVNLKIMEEMFGKE
jgi:hypothetical protein